MNLQEKKQKQDQKTTNEKSERLMKPHLQAPKILGQENEKTAFPRDQVRI